MCEELEISRDTYYKWLKRKNIKNRYELNHEALKPLIQKYYDLSNRDVFKTLIKYVGGNEFDYIRKILTCYVDSKTYINDKLKYLDEDVAKQAFLESDKAREGAKYDESKSLERWNVFLAESQKAQGMSLALDSGDTLFRDKDGKFYSADKNEVSKTSMPAYVREIWTQFQTVVGNLIDNDSVKVKVKEEKETPPDSSNHFK